MSSLCLISATDAKLLPWPITVITC